MHLTAGLAQQRNAESVVNKGEIGQRTGASGQWTPGGGQVVGSK